MVDQTLANELRALDVACRWGGEEFVIIVPNVTAESLARILPERPRKAFFGGVFWCARQGAWCVSTIRAGVVPAW